MTYTVTTIGQLNEADTNLTNLPAESDSDYGEEFDSCVKAAREAINAARTIAIKKGAPE